MFFLFEFFDISLWVNGYIVCWFFSGLDFVEYFFYCMVGREGLVDIVVKIVCFGYL